VPTRTITSLVSAPSTPVSLGPVSGRLIVAGQTQTGPVDAPRLVTTLREYTALYGARTGGTAMYDTVELALRCGVAEVAVQRAFGPARTAATVSLASGALVVTARYPGANANAWTAQYTSATKTLTVVTASGTRAYTGATAAALVDAAAYDPDVTVTTSGSLPGSDVASTPLASGTDDYANVSWAAVLALVGAGWGPGAVATPGADHTASGAALAAHAQAYGRLAVHAAPDASTAVQAQTALATVRTYTGAENSVLAWPSVRVPDGTPGGVKTVVPAGFVAGLRAQAHTVDPGQNPVAWRFAARVYDVTPVTAISDAEFATLEAAGVSVVAAIGGITRLYSWRTAAALVGNAALADAHYRDLANSVVYDGTAVCERVAVGAPGTPATYADVVSELSAVMAGHAAYLQPRYAPDGKQVDPGYRVEAGPGTSPVDNRISARIGYRNVETADWVDLVVAAGDATATI